MDRKLMYWLTGALAVILVLLLAFNFTNRRPKDPASPPSAGNDSEGSGTNGTSGMTNGASGMTAVPSGETSALPSSWAPADNLALYLSEQDQIMEDMTEEMRLDSPSGNASVDFLKGMIPHHEAAIAMADSLLKYGGENAEIKELAQNIIEVQKAEIEEMQQMIVSLSDEALKDEAKEAAYLEQYNKMFETPHARHVDAGGAATVDQAFAMGMIAHHQMAVDMARSIFEYSDSDQVREMAKTIIEAQEKEITQMQKLINEMQAG